jgi:LysM repeat protein
MVGWRNPARYIAPLALAAAITATYVIVHHAVANKHSSTTTPTVQTTNTVVSHSHSGATVSKARFYVVKPGDSLSGIAAKTGVSMATIEALNPSVNPNTIQPAQRLRLRR